MPGFAFATWQDRNSSGKEGDLPDKTKGTHSHRLQLRVPGKRSVAILKQIPRPPLLGIPRKSVPAGDFEGGAENRGTHEFRHFGGPRGCSIFSFGGFLFYFFFRLLINRFLFLLPSFLYREKNRRK